MKLILLKLKEGGGAAEEMVLMEIGFRFGNLSPVAPRHILVMGESLCRKWTHHRPKVPPHSLWTHIFHFCQKHKKIVSLKIFSPVCQYEYLGEHLVGSEDYSKHCQRHNGPRVSSL